VELVARMAGMRNVCNVFAGKSEGKRQLERLRRKWKNYVRMDHKELRAD